MSPAALAQGLRKLVVSGAGSPEQVGAPQPDADIFAAGLTQSQHYLGLVAEGRIRVRPCIVGVAGRALRFADGSAEAADGTILGTGYRLSLPFLAPDVAQALGLDDQHIDLHDHTFHPKLDGLAFHGLFDQVGPFFPVLDLQARWLAHAWAGVVAAPDIAAMQAVHAACRARRGGPQAMPIFRPMCSGSGHLRRRSVWLCCMKTTASIACCASANCASTPSPRYLTMRPWWASQTRPIHCVTL